MKKTLLIVMAMIMLIAVAGCTAGNRKDESKPTVPPSAEVLPDNSVNDGDIMDGDNAGEIPENGVDSGRDDAQNGSDVTNGEAANGVENGGYHTTGGICIGSCGLGDAF